MADEFANRYNMIYIKKNFAKLLLFVTKSKKK